MSLIPCVRCGQLVNPSVEPGPLFLCDDCERVHGWIAQVARDLLRQSEARTVALNDLRREVENAKTRLHDLRRGR